MIFFISVIPNLTTEGEDIELANINVNSVFTNSDFQSLKTTPSIVLLVYDGYPQLETPELSIFIFSRVSSCGYPS